MFDFKLTAPTPANDLPDATLFNNTTTLVRSWLKNGPDAGALLSNLPALELALAAHVKNRDPELLALAQDALGRLAAESNFSSLTAGTLAALSVLYLHAFQLTADESVCTAARRALDVAAGWFDEKLEYFTDARDTANVFHVDTNARLAEAFYFAWRVLDDQKLRPIAGAVLGQVCETFEANAGTLQRTELPDAARENLLNVNARARTVQMLLTASETTGRATYVSRARIVADFARDQHETAGAPPAAQVAFADALTRLERFTNAGQYQDAAGEILAAVQPQPAGLGSAAYALAVENSQNFPLHIAVIGDVENDANARDLWNQALKVYAPARAIEILNPTQHRARIESLGYSAAPDGALAYICIGPVCLPPVRSGEQFQASIARVRRAA